VLVIALHVPVGSLEREALSSDDCREGCFLCPWVYTPRFPCRSRRDNKSSEMGRMVAVLQAGWPTCERRQ
jgi:hypothetical protein